MGAQCLTPLSLPVAFEPNVGQADRSTQFIGRGKGLTILLTRQGIVLDAIQPLGNPSERRLRSVTLQLAGAGTFDWQAEEALRGESSYFIGSDPRGWHTHVPHFARVEGKSSASLAAISIYGNDEGVEYDLRIPPSADISKLRLQVSGEGRLRLSPSGDLLVRAGVAEVRMKQPQIFEEWTPASAGQRNDRIHARRRRVAGRYVLEPDGSVGFRVGPRHFRAALVIDPSLSISYASFTGGAGSETVAGIALDSAGKVYVGGTTMSSTTFPSGSGNRVGPASGPTELYVAKMDPTLSGANSLVYLTFLGGSAAQAGGLIAVDGSGRVAITGTTTSTDFPVTDASRATSGLTSGQGNDVTVSELDSTGSSLVFSTIFGGSGAESRNGAGGIALDSSGNVFVASDVQTTSVNPSSPDLPVTTGAFQSAWDAQASDGFLAIFQPPSLSGGAPTLTYCSYLGTNSGGPVSVGGIALDKSGDAYIAGSTDNSVTGFPAKNAIQSLYGGGDSDAFVMKVSPLGQGSTDLEYATLYGGSGADRALAVAVDSSAPPNAYVVGSTQSSNLPVNGTNAAFQANLRANPVLINASNAFLAVVAQDAVGGTRLTYATFLGGTVTDAARAVSVATPNQVYVAGMTSSADFPWRDNVQPFNGASDAFLAKFDPTASGAASLSYATPLGGTSPPAGTASAGASAVVADGNGHVYVAGDTTAADFPTAVTSSNSLNGFQPACASCQLSPPESDGFVVELAENSILMPSVYFSAANITFLSVPVGTQSPPGAVAVLNGGEASLTISSIQVIGPNAGDFSVTGATSCTGVSIQPGPTPKCSLEIAITPSVVGPETADLAISDNAPGSPQVLELAGRGQGPLASVAPSALDFGSQTENTVSGSRAITITNVGDQDLTVSSVQENGPDAAQFSPQTNSCSANTPIAPGASCAVAVAFAPTLVGTFHAEIDLQDNSGGATAATQTVPLSGTGIAPGPIATILPSSMAIDFGTVTTGASSGPQTVTLENTGSASLNITGISLTGTNAADFALETAGTTCSLTSGSLSAGSSCTVAVRFAPQSAGTGKSAILKFVDNAPGSPQQVTLSGNATPASSLQVSPASLGFSPQSEGTSSGSQNVTISNSGSTAAALGAISVSGPNSGDFTVQNPCGPVLAAGKSCQVGLSFAPAVSVPPGSRSATLNVAGGSPSAVSLTGTATQSGVTLPTSFSFAPQLAGTASAAQPVNVTNSSSGPLAGGLTVSSITKSGANAGDFLLSTDHCTGATTAPGQTCTVQLAFQPTQAATCGTGSARSATLTINDNAPGSPHTVPLSGTATDFCLGSPSGQPVSSPISPGQSATYSMEISSSAGFTGSVSLACSGAPPLGSCAVTTNPPSTPPTVEVTTGNPAPFQVVVTTMADMPTTAKRPLPNWPRPPIPALSLWLMAACIAALFSATRLLRRSLAHSGSGSRAKGHPRPLGITEAGAFLLAVVLAMAACGGGGGGDAVAAGTPLGTYTVTVTATGPSGATHSIPLSLTVQ